MRADVETGGQAPARAREPAHDGADGQAEHVGGLLVAHAVEHHQGEHGALRLGQLLEGLRELLGLDAGVEGLPAVLADGLVRFVERLAAAAVGAQLVAPEVLRDAVQPAVQARAGLEGLGVLQGALDGGLGQVVGIGRGAGQGMGETPQAGDHPHELVGEFRVWLGPHGTWTTVREREYSIGPAVLDTVDPMKPRFYRILALILAMAVAWPVAVGAKDGEREIRETRAERDLREDREERAERELRDLREAEERAAKELEDAREDAADAERDAQDAAEDAAKDAEDAAEDAAKDAEDEASRSGSGEGGRRTRERLRVERESSGVDRLRDEVLLVGGDTAGEAVRRAGFEVIAERRLESLRQSMLRIRVRDGESVERAVRALREVVPGARVAPNHVFRPSAAAPVGGVGAAGGALAPVRSSTAAAGAEATPADIGIIDTGADRQWPTLVPAIVRVKGFAPGGYVARPHGTAVARIAAAQGARLAVADVFGVDQRNALAASADRIAAGLDWLHAQRIRVVNISIEGPDNLVLQYVVEQAIADGMAIVAAAGNGGPAARPAFPAAYPGVIAVTAVDERGQVYRRAARGAHVQFAARGVYRDGELLSGTSFAAPAVAAQLAARWRREPAASREQLLGALRGTALDKGAPGRDPVYGWGVLGE